jgi:two-component system, OmpR family, phosphate regulon sensor histidine kinase PhoR
MRLVTRLFASISLLVAAAVAGSIMAADVVLRRHLDDETAMGLERDAQLVAALAPADSSRWPDFARVAGGRLGRRVTLIDPSGRVRGDTEFDRTALARLENHAGRPEVRAALATGTGRDARLSASTNARQLYVAVRAGPSLPGLSVVRVSASLATVDARIHAVQRAVAGAGVGLLVVAGLVAWLVARALARPLVAIAGAARDIAAGRPAAFPEVRVPELARLVDALREMHQELERRFAALHREQEESRTLLEALSDGVVAADARGTIVSCNTAARRLLGYDASEPLPPLAQLFHDRPHRALVRDLLAGQVVEQRELELAGRTVLVSGRPLEGGGGGTLLVLSDVSDVRRLEAVRRDFVANVSHELKTPLTAIAGYAETLAHEAPAESQMATFGRTIVQNARRMQRLVDDLLDLSRIESGGWRPQPRVVEIEAAARDAWSAFAERAASAKVRFETAVTPDAHALPVDPDSLRQVFTNLFDNALRHTPAGGRLRVAAELSKDGIALSVTDTGSGIPAEHLPRIFERFYRVDPGRAREEGGTGLGLAIVKHLVEAHGGRVEAESALGRGTTIRMHFPTPAVTKP